MRRLVRLVRIYRDLPTAVRQWLPYWLLAAGVFSVPALLGTVIGTKRETAVVFPVRQPGDPAPILSAIDLFAHNASLALMVAFGGFTFGIYPLYVLVFNGLALGSVAADAAGVYGVGRTLLMLVPHGVFELPAIWLSAAVAFRWTHVVWAIANGADRSASVPQVVVRSLVAVGIVLVLLAVAAVIEAHVSVLFVP